MKNWIKTLSIFAVSISLSLGVVYLRPAQSSSIITSQVITGTIIAFAGPTCPYGYVGADGSSLARAGRYANLFGVLSTKWGAADGSHFNVPDLRGRFLRGRDAGAGHDPDAASRIASTTGGATGDSVGTLQADGLGTHSHGVTDPGHVHGVSDPGHVHGYTVWVGHGQNGGADGTYGGGSFGLGNTAGTNTGSSTTGVSINNHTTGISINNAGGNETRPVNVNVQYCIAF